MKSMELWKYRLLNYLRDWEKYMSVSLDLTKQRYNLYKFAKGIVKEMEMWALFVLTLIVLLPYVLKMVLLNILTVSMSSVHY